MTGRGLWLTRVACALFGFAALLAQRLVDQDLFGHLYFGRAAVLAGHVLQQDPYTFVPHEAVWYNHEWLWETSSWLLYAWGGDRALLLTKALTGSAMIVLLGLIGLRRGVQPLVLLVSLALVALAVQPDVHVRPYMATYAFFPLCLYLLQQAPSRPVIAALITLFAVWANTHAAFVVGLGTVVIYAGVAFLEHRPVWKTWLGVALASAVAVCLNPYGPAYWPFVLQAVTMKRPYITEFRHVPWDLSPLHDPFIVYKVLLAVAVVAIGLAWRSRSIDWHGVILLTVTGAMSLSAYRHVPLFLLSWGAFVPAMLPSWRAPLAPWMGLLVGLGWAGAQLAQGLHLQVPTRPVAVSDHFFPYDAVRFIKANGLHGDIADFFDWGEFLIWELPDSRVSFDGRLETVYRPDTIQQNLAFLAGDDPDYPRRVGADLVLVPLPSKVASELLADHVHWLPVYGGDAALFVSPAFSHPHWILPPQETDAELVPLTGPPSIKP